MHCTNATQNPLFLTTTPAIERAELHTNQQQTDLETRAAALVVDMAILVRRRVTTTRPLAVVVDIGLRRRIESMYLQAFRSTRGLAMGKGCGNYDGLINFV